MTSLSEVCAVIDAQGFTVNKKFHIRELAVSSANYKQCNLCKTGLTYRSMSDKDRRTANYVSNHLLGLSLGYTLFESTYWQYGESMLVSMYGRVKTEHQPYVAIKNHQLIPLLESLQIPYVKLEDYGCPQVGLLKVIYDRKHCHFHEREVPDEDKLLCAEAKADSLWRWIIDYLKRK